jgi:hypothetical protein
MHRVLILCLFILAHPAMASSGAHGGGDNKKLPATHAWFSSVAGRTNVRFCFHRDASNTIPSAEAELAGLVEEAFGVWMRYMKDNAHKRLDDGGSTKYLRNLSLHYSALCQKDTEIVVYVGSEDAVVTRAKTRYQNPIAFAELLDFDLDKGWGRGFIWLHPATQENPYIASTSNYGIRKLTWDNRLVLKSMLLHELGHVLGVPHISGTIMTDTIVDHIVGNLRNSDRTNMPLDTLASLLGAIEFGNSLLPCEMSNNGCVRRVFVSRNPLLFSIGLDHSRSWILNMIQKAKHTETTEVVLEDPSNPTVEIFRFSMSGMGQWRGANASMSFNVCHARQWPVCDGIQRPTTTAIGSGQNGKLYLFKFNQDSEVEIFEHSRGTPDHISLGIRSLAPWHLIP